MTNRQLISSLTRLQKARWDIHVKEDLGEEALVCISIGEYIWIGPNGLSNTDSQKLRQWFEGQAKHHYKWDFFVQRLYKMRRTLFGDFEKPFDPVIHPYQNPPTLEEFVENLDYLI